MQQGALTKQLWWVSLHQVFHEYQGLISQNYFCVNLLTLPCKLDHLNNMTVWQYLQGLHLYNINKCDIAYNRLYL